MWRPIETYPDEGWGGPLVWLKSEDGEQAKGCYGFIDEIVSDDGDESLIFGWIDDDGEALGFEPTHWKPLEGKAVV